MDSNGTEPPSIQAPAREGSSRVTEALKNGVTPAFQSMKRAFSSFGENANKVIKDSVENVKKGVDKTVDASVSNAKSFGENANKAIKDSVGNVKKGVDKTVEVSVSAVNKTVDAGVSAVKNFKENQQQTKEDIYCATEEEALNKLKEWIEETKASTPHNKRPQKWNFTTIPLSCFDKTLDDVLLSFCRWARNDVNDDEKVNMTRVYERLTAYATYMDTTSRDLIDPPLTTESIKESWKTWGIKISYNKAGRLVIWFDLSQIDLAEVKKIPPEESLRLFVWFSHFLLFDLQAQENGCVLIQNMGKIPFLNSVTLIPSQLAHKIDRLTIGTVPVRMKQIYLCESPKWTHALLAIMKPFLSQTVKDRILFLENPKMLEDILGQECIPSNFTGTDGKMERDSVWSTYSIGY